MGESSGFILSDAAQYAFDCQEVYSDIVSFAAAIPEHLKPIFLIPVKAQIATASTLAARKMALGTGDDDLFSYRTFVVDDVQPLDPSTDPGSIFNIPGPNKTRHQEYDFDQNIQAPIDTSYMSTIDDATYNALPKWGSSKIPVLVIRFAKFNSKHLETKAPDKIKDNAKTCTVQLVSYDKPSRVFTFSVRGNSGPRTVQVGLSDIENVAMSCDCPFWRWNGPEFHAKSNHFMLGQPFGKATPPNVRDPDRKYWLCKHAYAVLKRFDEFVSQIKEENIEVSEKELVEKVDENWDRMEGAVEIPLEEAEADDVAVDWVDGVEQVQEQQVVQIEQDEPEQQQIEIEQDFEQIEQQRPYDDGMSEQEQIEIGQGDYQVVDELPEQFPERPEIPDDAFDDQVPDAGEVMEQIQQQVPIQDYEVEQEQEQERGQLTQVEDYEVEQDQLDITQDQQGVAQFLRSR